MRFNELTVKDRELFDKFLNLSEHELSVYAFPNIYIWKRFYDIHWSITEDCLCVFFRDKTGVFLYLPPLGGEIKSGVLTEAFKIMDGFNHNRDISRIENVEERGLSLYEDLGYEYRYKSSDYVCGRQELVDLRTDKFKSKRAAFNYFVKHYPCVSSEEFSLEYKKQCLDLFDLWAFQRKSKNCESLYQGMIDDSKACLDFMFAGYENLNISGRLFKIDGQLKAFTFGFRLNHDSFCILYEITDLSIKGLAQFVFRRFCSELGVYRYINMMDDSGLENLKKVKLSYHPVKLVPAYIVKRKSDKLLSP